MWTKLMTEETTRSVFAFFLFSWALCSAEGQQSLQELVCRNIRFPFKTNGAKCDVCSYGLRGRNKAARVCRKAHTLNEAGLSLQHVIPQQIHSHIPGSRAGSELICFHDISSQKLTDPKAWRDIQDVESQSGFGCLFGIW